MSRENIFLICGAPFIRCFHALVEIILSLGAYWVDLSNIISLCLDLDGHTFRCGGKK